MLFIYNFLFYFFLAISKIFALFLPKLKERNSNLNKSLAKLDNLDVSQKTIWFHSASMGEFEQAKPIIEFLKNSFKNSENINEQKNINEKKIQIVCTFFSPSGYNSQKNYSFADAICYLPNDTYFSAKKFIEKIKPEVVVFVRYELWLNYLTILRKKNIFTILVNATYPTQLKKSNLLKIFYKKIFNNFNEIYAVSYENTSYFNELDLKSKIISSNDTRIDRITQKVNEAKQFPIISKDLFSKDEIILVAGSVWKKDVDILLAAYNKFCEKFPNKLRLILVPHEQIGRAHV